MERVCGSDIESFIKVIRSVSPEQYSSFISFLNGYSQSKGHDETYKKAFAADGQTPFFIALDSFCLQGTRGGAISALKPLAIGFTASARFCLSFTSLPPVKILQLHKKKFFCCSIRIVAADPTASVMQL